MGSVEISKELFFKGPEMARKIYLILDEENEHYHVISSPKAFFGLNYFCENRNVAYGNRLKHSCSVKCHCCSGDHPKSLKRVNCDECNLEFYGRDCYLNHKVISGQQKKSICQLYKTCPLCNVPSATASHTCGTRCQKCHVHYTGDEHQCFLTTKKSN